MIKEWEDESKIVLKGLEIMKVRRSFDRVYAVVVLKRRASFLMLWTFLTWQQERDVLEDNL